jgi:hypothetical protein
MKRSRLFVLCFPHLGTLDSWLSIINRMNDLSGSLTFTLIIPDANIVRSFHRDNAVVKISNNIFDVVLIHAYDDTWVKYASVYDSINWSNNNRTKLRLFDILQRLKNKRLFYYILIWPLILLRNSLYKKEFRLESKDINRCASRADILLYDIHVENNYMTSDVLQLFESNNKYSLPHALNMLIPQTKLPQFTNVNNKDNIKVYIHAKFQSRYYDLRYKIGLDKICIAGIPRHEPEWIKTIQSQSRELPYNFNDNNTVIVLSRHASNAHLLFNEKMKSVKNIKKIFIDSLSMKVVIKVHPNEKNSAENIYEDVFGLDNYGITWTYSELHVFALCKGKRLAIGFNTSVVLDVIATGIPCVEYIESPNNNGKNMTEFSENRLIKRVSNEKELSIFVNKWLQNPNEISMLSSSTYKEFFPMIDNTSGNIATEILHDNGIHI